MSAGCIDLSQQTSSGRGTRWCRCHRGMHATLSNGTWVSIVRASWQIELPPVLCTCRKTMRPLPAGSFRPAKGGSRCMWRDLAVLKTGRVAWTSATGALARAAGDTCNLRRSLHCIAP
eukprot:7391141-Prymnesium_polylepis.1